MAQIQSWMHFLCGFDTTQSKLNKPLSKLLELELPTLAKRCNVELKGFSLQIDHIHFLVNLSVFQSAGDAVNDLRNAIHNWGKENLGLVNGFVWNTEYFVASVSHSRLDNLLVYFTQQEELHQRKSFEVEYAEFISLHGL